MALKLRTWYQQQQSTSNSKTWTGLLATASTMLRFSVFCKERRQNTMHWVQCLHISAKFSTNNNTFTRFMLLQFLNEKKSTRFFVSSFHFVFLRKCLQVPHHDNSVNNFHGAHKHNEREVALSIFLVTQKDSRNWNRIKC